MGRLRSTLAKSDADKNISSLLYEAEMILTKALILCDQVSKEESNKIEQRRSLRVKSDLRKVLGAMEKVRRITPSYDMEDEDLKLIPKKKERVTKK